MALPEQVRLQSEAAAKYFSDLGEGGETPATPPVTSEVLEPPTVPPVQVPPAVVTEPPPASTPPAEDYEQKYKTLQGMFNLELPKLRADVKERDDKLAQM